MRGNVQAQRKRKKRRGKKNRDRERERDGERAPLADGDVKHVGARHERSDGGVRGTLGVLGRRLAQTQPSTGEQQGKTVSKKQFKTAGKRKDDP